MKLAIAAVLILAAVSFGQKPDRDLAARYAPTFYQALGDKPRSDYITNFDFDGDWRGDNNWLHTDDKRFKLRAYVYYAVSETRTHYFIQYAVFHPRDYKGGETKGLIISGLLRQGAEAAGKSDPTGLLDDAALAHENDMEGALVVVDRVTARLAYVQTLHHNRFSAYRPEDLKMDGDHPLLYVEPKGHGIEAFSDDKKTGDKKDEERKFMIYKYAGIAGDPETTSTATVTYALLPIATTLWQHAAGTAEKTSYGATHDYGEITLRLAGAAEAVVERKVKIGDRGSAFLGRQGGLNMARPPWGWFDLSHRDDPLGLWFFDPATVLKRDLNPPETFSTVYTQLPFWAAK